MAASSKGQSDPEWIIDLHGIKEMLTSTSTVKSSIINAIQSGKMLVMRSVQIELKATYEHLWPAFVAIKPKKYADTTVPDAAVAAQLQEMHGTSALGGVPDFSHFEAVAVARRRKCKLVTAGKALERCSHIASKCGLPKGQVVALVAV